MTAFIVLALPVICLGAAVVIGKRAFKKTGCARTAFRKHFISVMLAALLCVAFTAFVSAAGRVEVCRGGAGIPFSEEEAKKVLTEPEITLDIRLHDGDAAATAWGCDLTYDYVKINGDYRT